MAESHSADPVEGDGIHKSPRALTAQPWRGGYRRQDRPARVGRSDGAGHRAGRRGEGFSSAGRAAACQPAPRHAAERVRDLVPPYGYRRPGGSPQGSGPPDREASEHGPGEPSAGLSVPVGMMPGRPCPGRVGPPARPGFRGVARGISLSLALSDHRREARTCSMVSIGNT